MIIIIVIMKVIYVCKLTNDSNEDKSLSLKAGQGMVQGIFFEFGIVEDDDVTEERNGGFGSTTK